ncbi:hypothetical protein MUU72_05215 [Streptomyces sp. RS10V-4]|uniref:hypothetical protein n=1 Tax=Streptomyces rhizoryzae TaxID=2932493 RepID=UPI00200448C0|nr:hypothetical protein [Streptomyces rhizoryzae]MCK7622513.1 hypothetical protein [Streptomyces rhizoryzae]
MTTLPDKMAFLSLSDMVLAWEPQAPPDTCTALNAVELLDEYGRRAERDLRALAHSVPVPPDIAARVQATLGEASRRLCLRPPPAGHTVRRAQNLVRLLQALHRATDLLDHDHS